MALWAGRWSATAPSSSADPATVADGAGTAADAGATAADPATPVDVPCCKAIIRRFAGAGGACAAPGRGIGGGSGGSLMVGVCFKRL